MLARSITALAALAFAVNAAAEPQPYKPQLMKMSTRQLFAIGRRQDTPGYQPGQTACGTGNTCEEACGSGYTTCSSSDKKVHCFNPLVGQTCCPDLSGNSCDAGYYCTADKAGETWCCPNGMDLQACAAAYSVTGGLVSQTPAPATSTIASSTAAPSTTEAPSTTAASSSSIIASSSSVFGKNSTTSAIKTTSTCTGTASLAPSSSPASNATISIITSPSPSISRLPESGANLAAPLSGLLLIAGLAALL